MSTPTDQWKKSGGEDGRINVVGVQGKKKGRRWKRKGKAQRLRRSTTNDQLSS